MNPKTENQVYVGLLYGHLREFSERLRMVPADKWAWQIEPCAPSPKILAEHAWQWLVCDRQHILEADAAQHPDVPALPDTQQALCDLLEAEAETWRALIMSLTPEQMDAPRSQFNAFGMNVRGFVLHIIQNTIYKHGQFATLYFALGLDGTEPYDAPFPNPIYARLRAGEPLD